MFKFSPLAALLLSVIFSLSSLATAATNEAPASGYEQYVVAEDAVTQYINGELRFCQRRNLKGRICGTRAKVFGREFFEPGNWWTAKTFAQAYTQLENLEVTQVAPGPQGSIIIYFRMTALQGPDRD